MVDRTDVEFGLTIAAVPVTILILVMAAYWTRKENKFGMSAIIVSMMTVIKTNVRPQLTLLSSSISQHSPTSFSNSQGSIRFPSH